MKSNLCDQSTKRVINASAACAEHIIEISEKKKHTIYMIKKLFSIFMQFEEREQRQKDKSRSHSHVYGRTHIDAINKV